MLLNKLYNAIKEIVESYPMVAPNDAKTPYAVYGCQSKPKRTKEGIYAYEYDAAVIVCDDDIDKLEENKKKIIAVVEALAGSDKIYKSLLVSEKSAYDKEAGIYVTNMNFEINQSV